MSLCSLVVANAQTFTVDTTFNPSDTGVYHQFVGLYGTVLNNGKIITTENMISGAPFDIGAPGSIYRLNSDGSIDNSFTRIDVSDFVNQLFANTDQGNFITVILDSDTGSRKLKSYDNNGTVVAAFTSPSFIKTHTPTNGQTVYEPGDIRKIYFLNDGKFLIFGNFNLVNGVAYNNIIRLNANGSVDTGFNIGTGFSGPTTAFALQDDGKYIVGGNFSSYNGTARGKIARLLSDGTLDTSFNVYTVSNVSGISYGYANAPINDIIIQPDGKIVTAGASVYSNGSVLRKDIIRLNTNGNIDTGFHYFSNYSGDYVTNLLYDADGSIYFKVGPGTQKCNSTGGLISTFRDLNLCGNTDVIEGKMQKLNNKIVIIGSYKNTAGITRIGYHRLNTADGSIDLTFNPSYGTNNVFYRYMRSNTGSEIHGYMLPDNKIILYGEFTTYNDIPVKNMIRLLENGELDTSFNLNLAPINNYSINFNYELNIQTKKNYNGDLYFNGTFSSPNGPDRYILKIKHDGTLDSNFLFFDPVSNFRVTDNNKIIGCISFYSGGVNQFKISRFNANATLDNTYVSPVFSKVPVYLELVNNDKTLISFGYNRFTNTNPFVTLNENGATVPMNSVNYYPQVYKTKSINNKIYASAMPDYLNSPILFRYNADWTQDTSFTTIVTSNSLKYVLLSNERTVTKTETTGQYPYTFSYKINNSNGTQISSVSLPVEARSLLSQSCENIVVIGDFYRANNSNRNNIYRLTVPNTTVIPTPTGDLNQLFSQGQTLADLIVNGQNIQWYTAQSDCAFNALDRNESPMNNILPMNTLLTNGTTYYASQIINGIESNHRLPVTANMLLGVDDFVFTSYFKLYPNPTSSVLNISKNNDIELESVTIYNTLGQLVKIIPDAKTENTIDVSNLSAGNYYIKVTTNKGTANTKFIKQ